MKKTIVWLRRDLRTFDHSAFQAAIESSQQVAAVYIEDTSDPWATGSASRWWLHFALQDLSKKLEEKGIPLLFLKGDPRSLLQEVMEKTEATTLFYQPRVEPHARLVEASLLALSCQKFTIKKTGYDLLHQPEEVRPATAPFYQVFTPFWKKLLTTSLKKPFGEIPCAKKRWELSLGISLEELGLLPLLGWDALFYKNWNPTQEGGWVSARSFIDQKMESYAEKRDRPDIHGVSRLGPYLHFGQISLPQFVQAVAQKNTLLHPLAHPFTRQLAWREFAHHLLWHAPHTTEKPLRSSFESFAWKKEDSHLLAWQRGQTGFPLIDAAMRCLWQTGWMHNRLRMVVGSFLVKNLLIDWKEGASWFWQTLLDADLANNTMGWQWIAGCGADAAPFFRIFNPHTQSQKFDPEGHFIRTFLPELQDLPSSSLHTQTALEWSQWNLDYPKPIVEHGPTRERALAAYKSLTSH